MKLCCKIKLDSWNKDLEIKMGNNVMCCKIKLDSWNKDLEKSKDLHFSVNTEEFLTSDLQFSQALYIL